MSTAFPLAGLLRYRRLREEQAAGSLAGARQRVQDVQDRQTDERQRLQGSPVTIDSPASMQAVAAARAASRALLTELEAADARSREDAQQAQLDYNSARAQTLGLEKLADRHADSATAEELRGEQLILDELTSSSWKDRNGGARP
ncbi:flagellar export protein FliJ [Arthrobacter roseus]|uniref:flagellar export protein FliJ n=1 Tax=Arthrobacter roseus TaxID=136274 RepID=UPI0019650B00|nr:flagellar FliJ family protein [Arthrobacter roseus]MBM7847663.1 flagellar FliJ protein [Arthrobacter roseus]